jgi:alanine racemase
MRAWIEVDLNTIRANVDAIQKWIGPAQRIMTVVKADAYGHGLVPVAQTALEAGARWLGVATVEEGVTLREAGVSAPVCLLCPCALDEVSLLVEYGLTATIGDVATLDALGKTASKAAISAFSAISAISRAGVQIHLDIDTGIGRSGAQPSDAVGLWQRAVRAGLRVTGVATHFSDADNPDETLTGLQEIAFVQTLDALRHAGARFDWIHADNSPATLRCACPSANLVRPGLLLYGIAPFPSMPPLFHPALALKARIATVRELSQGHPISYGATVRLTRPSRVATALIGYGDGYPRRLSNRGHMLVRGQRAPILGRVCMDQTVIDVTDIPEASAGDIAVCIGAQGAESLTVEEIALLIDTTPHEITTCLTARLPRLYNGKQPPAVSTNVDRR